MKKVISLLLLIVLVLTIAGCGTDDDKPILSELSEKKCMDFIISQGVVIPEHMKRSATLGSFVKDIITQAEKSPEGITSAYSSTVMVDFVLDIQYAVNDYYGIPTTTPAFLPERKCLDLIVSLGVVIPDELKGPNLGLTVKNILMQIHARPDINFIITSRGIVMPDSYEDPVTGEITKYPTAGIDDPLTHNFIEQIRKAVNEYWGVQTALAN